MKPMALDKLIPLLKEARHTELLNSPARAVMGTYRKLKSKDTLRAAEKRLLFECCLMIETYNFSNSAGEANAVRIDLQSRFKTFRFRPKPKAKPKAKSKAKK